ncbi:hypothetical protein [Mesobacillus selenatarsenatis]|uniref:Uncharacterized protein n=1 Tax=Mesobacillus selenatarsenatis (strain DSM 18680 / JCM 14380 / FERM P-15431 / SF-1) TaxID=1321606 RepID=A0A0A8WZS0_MESS1|nr:hypothetical protein [Mesobacillus selenatarsenatis]GAM12459.1 hypothetical protein SAMD00020551_0593 [Mesobacillus selenatarsenatis SF-1]
MTIKSLVVTLGTLILTTGLLFLVGHIFTIRWLMFYYEYTSDAEGFFISGGSMIPLIVGLISSFIAEKVYAYKQNQNHG